MCVCVCVVCVCVFCTQEVIPSKYLDDKTVYHLQPSGKFVIGGPQASDMARIRVLAYSVPYMVWFLKPKVSHLCIEVLSPNMDVVRNRFLYGVLFWHGVLQALQVLNLGISHPLVCYFDSMPLRCGLVIRRRNVGIKNNIYIYMGQFTRKLPFAFIYKML